ncbi:uncharacterized protein [Nicotiana tomentosiformis]|uniref:uncharacterized protein n=1 Tax=Nicotiana tomentosiformis TaxID=4098 RepID=UPI00388CD4AB
MVSTHATGSDGQPPVPPVRAMRGRGHGRGRGRGIGRGAASTASRAAPIDPPVAPAQEQVPDIVKPMGPTQTLAMPIVIPRLQETLAQILTVCTSLARVVLAKAAPATSQLTGTTFRWWEAYERSRLVGAAPLSWHEFSIFVLEKIVPQTRIEELRRQFEQLRQEDISVTQYEMRLSDLAHHAIWLVPTERENIRMFINGLNQQFCFVMTLGNVAGAKFDEVVDSARRLEMVRTQEHGEREANRSCGPGNSSNVPFGGRSYHNRGRPYRPAAHRGASASHGSYSARLSQSSLSKLPGQSSSRAPSVQGLFVPSYSGSYSGSRGPPQYLPPLSEKCCFECGDLGHMKRRCPHLLRDPVQQKSQAATPAPVISPPAQPARGGA